MLCVIALRLPGDQSLCLRNWQIEMQHEVRLRQTINRMLDLENAADQFRTFLALELGSLVGNVGGDIPVEHHHVMLVQGIEQQALRLETVAGEQQ